MNYIQVIRVIVSESMTVSDSEAKTSQKTQTSSQLERYTHKITDSS